MNKQTHKFQAVWSDAVRQLAAGNNISAVAKALNLDRSTLHRHLTNDVKFVEAIDAEKRKLAQAGLVPQKVHISIDAVLSPTLEIIRTFNEAELTEWHRLRGVLFRNEVGHPQFDPRKTLALKSEDEQWSWSERKRAWAAKILPVHKKEKNQNV